MKVARVNSQRLPILTGPGGMGGSNQSPPAAMALDDLTDVDTSGVADGDTLIYDAGTMTWLVGPSGGASLWVPVMVEDGATGLWYVTVTGDGDAVMTEVPL